MVLVVMQAPWSDDRWYHSGTTPPAGHWERSIPYAYHPSHAMADRPESRRASAADRARRECPRRAPRPGSVGAPPHTATSPPVQEQEGPLLLLRVRALVPDKVTLSDPAQRTVRATVLAIDEERNQIKVQTDAGQRLGLFLPPETLAHLRLGTRCLLQVARESMQDAARPPVQEGPFW